ncbi:Fic family protein [uncultured Collinsella sp.]|uniref:Fic family protein n=1 Tax=uncultured Collinsella sp. TaxID=165190 RepID=UPI002671131F|nr:Fic family protein [uncultured Collinsella sp.]
MPEYDAAVPHMITHKDVFLDSVLSARMSDLLISIARFDGEQAERGYDLPALLLRSESSASSQIERLTSSVRNVALAELTDETPQNARLIAGNIAAMREALSARDELTVESILDIHRALINWSGETFGGELREEQVWVGGTPYSPHGAQYVPPAWERVPEYLDDMVRFASRDDVDPVVQAAVLHAQFETVHPFIDGNGRTGRVLLHKMLRKSGVMSHVTLPVSAGLLHNVDAYMESLDAYQQGDPIAVVRQLVEALELSLVVGRLVARSLDDVFEGWREIMTERENSSIYKLPSILAEQPVVNVAYVASELDITPRAAQNVVSRACEYEILRPIGNRRRGVFFQADELIAILEEASSLPSIRRMVASVR